MSATIHERSLALARILRRLGTAQAENELAASIVTPGGWLLPDGTEDVSLSRAIGAWLDTATPRHGRPPGSARPGHHVTLKLSLKARARLDLVPRLERGHWVSALIEAAR